MAAAYAVIAAVLLGLGVFARAIATAPRDPQYGEADPNHTELGEDAWL